MSEVFTSSLEINATPEEVFDYFLKPELLVRWMGEFARLEAVNGGLFSVDIDGVLIRGEYVSIQRPNLIEIAWGEAGNERMPPGSTQLQIVLQPSANGTTLTLTHSGFEESEAKKHAFGWPHFLARLAIAAIGGDPGPYPWAKNNA